jgi:hypothetical protein
MVESMRCSDRMNSLGGVREKPIQKGANYLVPTERAEYYLCLASSLPKSRLLK